MNLGQTALHRPTAIIGVGLIALAAITWFDARGMSIRSNYGVGADAASYFVAAFLAVLGLAHLVTALRPGITADHADWSGVAWIGLALGGLIGSIWLGLGFILGSTLLFALTARAFGRQALVADLVIGAVISTGVFLMFNKLLQLALPMGPLERLF
ncbi:MULTISPECIES: tripartite tricarboxylate transporter TctB family protein [unclassified Paracoccus (in: a-proteobacteria)]|uniref:tripartite tricarboxylate transporter TctB family protein n=1 Tax=unclassified Paracoccus (in: a-proteobacteria) TaxID=2688777 RepID=UPI0016041894|nr:MULTISPECIES: tripartite tricarboxylate transporter TctB family protein [unclassified Paracoccus (in: a-proteobacteria)]MBB1492820.1 tripartite tricarboxylate transporter TctB family protein [Paracoccus sp. MC1854]MBB1499255.1 tripartite tricarboxylate transporter TctB family protein [Paracoccus sp. MC1862]QQO45844.1 tripartite tricarboxylate transporter TctB family protein [Paracoccus sp. MC1862]